MSALVRSIATSPAGTALAVALLAAAAVALGVAFFDASVPGAIAFYFVVWWTALFAVLPFGIRSQAEAGEVVAGSDPGAPAVPALAEKAIWTSLVAGLVFLAALAALPLAGL